MTLLCAAHGLYHCFPSIYVSVLVPLPLLRHNPRAEPLSQCTLQPPQCQARVSGQEYLGVCLMWPLVQELWGTQACKILSLPQQTISLLRKERPQLHIHPHKLAYTHSSNTGPSRDLALSESVTKFGPETRAANVKLAQRLAPVLPLPEHVFLSCHTLQTMAQCSVTEAPPAPSAMAPTLHVQGQQF